MQSNPQFVFLIKTNDVVPRASRIRTGGKAFGCKALLLEQVSSLRSGDNKLINFLIKLIVRAAFINPDPFF